MSDKMPNPHANIIKVAGLGSWNAYFLIKFVLFWNQSMGLHALPNLAFAAYLLAPIKNRFISAVRRWLAIPIGIALFYYDSWLPPFHRLVSEANLVQTFNAGYMLELVQRFINVEWLAIVFIIWVAYLLIGRYVRVAVLVVSYLLYLAVPMQQWFPVWYGIEPQQVVDSAVPVSTAVQNKPFDLNDYLSQFYVKEKQRVATFESFSNSDVPFDVLFIHICSLSWDDLKYAQREDELPLFDVLFSNFNTAASYSGPAAIRILRAGCGQVSHADLYTDANAQCYLFDNLKKIGFKNELVLNHDGHFDDFVGVIQKRGHLHEKPMSLAGLPVPLRSFDGSPVYSDLDTLNRWFSLRDQEDSKRVVTLYNTISMHDGNRYTDYRSDINSTDNFIPRLDDLLANLKTFFKRLQQSGRRVLVVMIPEHGAAIHGDKMQMSGLREIPSPAIIHAPVGLRLIGPEITPPLNPLRVDSDVSYLDVTQVVSRLLASNPFASGQYDPDSLLDDVEGTAFVSENAGTVVLRHNGKYYIRLDGSDDWAEYPAEN